nr:hypothetical protein [Tanacetum cinerariifolium]
AQIKLYKTREDKDIEKVIDLENKVKVLDNIVYKTGQSVQTMNMLNNKCRTTFVKPEYLNKAKQANPRLYDIGCYNDNLALMLSPNSDETMALELDSLSPERKCQENISHGDKTVKTSNELDLLFSSMFDELLNGSSKVVSKSLAVSAADAPNQRQQPTTPLHNHTTHAHTC